MFLAQDLSCGCSQDISQGCRQLKVSLELEDVLLRWLTHTVLTVGRKPLFLPSGPFLGLLDYPYNMALGFPKTESKRRGKADTTMSLIT